MLPKLNWIRECADKICPSLRKELINTYRHWKWVPCFLHRPIEALIHRIFKHKVIVQLNPFHSSSFLKNNEKKILGHRVQHRFPLINGYSTKISTRSLQKMISNGEVTRVWLDQPVYALLDTASPVVEASPVWDTGNQGQGVGIAIVDTGIHPHPDLTSPNNRIIAFKDFIKKRANAYDDNGHGTHCAGDAAGNGYKSDGKYRGPAPKANLIGVKVLNKMGSGTTSVIIAGIQWCIDNKEKYNIKVISMSLGGTATQSAKNDPLCQAVRGAWNSGLVVCAAAGNEGPERGTIATPGIEPQIITVGAMDDKNTISPSDDNIASFSSRGPTIDGLTKPDLVTPGVRIISLRASNSYLDKTNPDSRVDSWYTSLSGTSMATPVCAGIVALMIEKSPKLTPDKVKTILINNCRSVDPDPNAQGAGLANALASVEAS